MKNIFLFLIGLGVFVAACNPMEDIDKEIDKKKEEIFKKDTFKLNRDIAPDAYTLTDEDYEMSSNEDIAKYKNFSAYALPKDFLPEILNKKFTAENAFAMMVTYQYYERPTVNEDNAYTISENEYLEMGLWPGYIGFDDEDKAESLIGKLLDRKVYAAEAGLEQTVEYNEYVRNQTRYIQVNADLSTEVLEDKPSGEFYPLTTDDYNALDQGYGNFSWIADAEEGVVTLAGLNGDVLPKIYSVEVYRNFFPVFTVYYHDGNNWMPKQSVMAVTEPLNYALNEDDITLSYWWADPAVKITLGTADYDMFSETSRYQNFDLRSGNTPGTDRAKLVEMVGQMLDANHSPVEDQIYMVSYAFYDGASGVGTIRVIKSGGTWSESDE